jgi:hypothetical protein
MRVLRRIAPLDAAMLLLALISLGLLTWDWFWPLTEDQHRAVFIADTTICGLFALEFLWRWHRQGWRRQYALRNWYEILGMIPVQHPALRLLRFLRVLRVIVVFSRFGMAVDRTLGDEYFFRITSRLKRALVASISGAVTAAVLEEVEDVLHKGTYTHNIANVLERNQGNLRTLVLDKLRQDPATGRFRRVPFYDDIVESVIEATLRVANEVLRDPRTDRFVADALYENLEQLRGAITMKEQQRETEHPMRP